MTLLGTSWPGTLQGRLEYMYLCCRPVWGGGFRRPYHRRTFRTAKTSPYMFSAFIAFFPREFITNTEGMGTHQPIFDATRQAGATAHCHARPASNAPVSRSERSHTPKPRTVWTLNVKKSGLQRGVRFLSSLNLGYTRARKADSKSSKAKILRDGQRGLYSRYKVSKISIER